MTSRRIPIGVRLLGPMTAVVALMVVIGVAAVASLGDTASRSDAGYADATEPLAALGLARAKANAIRTATYGAMLEPTEAGRQGRAAVIERDQALVEAALAKVRPTIRTAAGARGFAALRADLRAYRAERDRALAIRATGSSAEAFAYDARRVAPLFAKVVADFEALFASKVALAERGNAAVAETYRSGRALVVVLVLLAALVGLGATGLATRTILRTLTAIVDRLGLLRDHCTADLRTALDRMADGDLTVEVTPVTPLITTWSNDELGDAVQAVNQVRDNTVASVEAYNASRASLREIVAQMSATAGGVSAASQEMASTSEEAGRAVAEIANAISEVAVGSERQVHGLTEAQRLTDDVAEGSRRQAEGIRDASRLTQEVAVAITRSAEDAARTAEAAAAARQVAGEGSAAVAQAGEVMALAQATSVEATQVIRTLGEKSDQIGGIVHTISGIAEQTNLLALNAAIEAARAGDQGRGFAVVADEVRKLAEESQRAAATIGRLLTEIQAETGRAVEVVEEGAERAGQSAATVEQSREAFEAIRSSVEDVTQRVGQIAASVQQVTAAAHEMGGQINDAAEVAERSAAAAGHVGDHIRDIGAVAEEASASAEQVSASTEQTSASTQQIAASARELADAAEQLEALVGRFTVA